MRAGVLKIGNDVEPYRGYLVTKLIGGEFTVSKDGFHICYASDLQDAKRKIDEVA